MTYENLIAQRAELDKQIAQALAADRVAALKAAREQIQKFNFKERELYGPGTSPVKAPIKFRCPVTGKTWSGRGVRPSWVSATHAL